jgi:hypothetical protein
VPRDLLLLGLRRYHWEVFWRAGTQNTGAIAGEERLLSVGSITKFVVVAQLPSVASLAALPTMSVCFRAG